MSSPKPLEDKCLAEAALALDRSSISNSQSQRLEVLEAAASLLGGWSLRSYRDVFGDTKYQLSINEAVRSAEGVVGALRQNPVHPSLALCRLAQPPLSRVEQRRTGSYYTDFRLARFLARSVADSVNKRSTVIDAASGTGVLLVALALEVFGSDAAATEHFIAKRVFAADLSENALRGVRLALCSLARQVESLTSLQSHLLQQDSLATKPEEWTRITPGRFDLVIGNPPWEKLKLTKHEVSLELGHQRHYGAEHNLLLKDQVDGVIQSARNRMGAYVTHVVSQFPLAADGEFDLYKAFVELAIRLVKNDGSLALLIPAGLIRSSSTHLIRRELFGKAHFLEATVLDNGARFFAIDTRFKFLALRATFGEGTRKPLRLRHAEGSEDGVIETGVAAIARSTLRKYRPDLTVPEVRSAAEWDLYRKIMSAGVRLDQSSWKPTPLREVDMTRDRSRFVTSGPNLIPVIEGRMVHQFRVGAKGYVSGSGRRAIWNTSNPGKSTIRPQFWIAPEHIPSAAAMRVGQARVGFCDVTGQTNERTILAAMIPEGTVCGNKVPTLLFGDHPESLPWSWLAIANSFVFDWMARRIVTTTVNYFLLMSLPMPSIDPRGPEARDLARRAKELQRLDSDRSLDLSRVAFLRADLDARVARLFGLSRDDLTLVLADFPLLDRNQPPLLGEDRSSITRDAVLAAFERLDVRLGSAASDRYQSALKAGAVAFIPAQYDSAGSDDCEAI
jgi:methylase of polypeptide subunit release factors